MKQIVKLAIFSSLPNVKDEIYSIFENSQNEFKNYNYCVNDLCYEFYISELSRIINETCSKNQKEMITEKEDLIYEFMMRLCLFNPHFILFGPLIPYGFDEFEIIKSIAENLQYFMNLYQKKHQLEIWRHKHKIQFISTYHIQKKEHQEEFKDMGFCLLEKINDSITENKKILKEYFMKIDNNKIIKELDIPKKRNKLIFV